MDRIRSENALDSLAATARRLRLANVDIALATGLCESVVSRTLRGLSAKPATLLRLVTYLRGVAAARGVEIVLPIALEEAVA